MKRFLMMIAVLLATMPAWAETINLHNSQTFTWNVAWPGATLADTASFTVSPVDEVITLRNSSTNRVWLSFNAKTNINPGVINVTFTNSGSTAVAVTNITGISTNVIGVGGIVLPPAGDNSIVVLTGVSATNIFLLGENVLSNRIDYLRGK